MKQRSLIRENIKNISYQSIAQIIPRAMMFIFIFYLARLLGNAEYGKYEFATSFGYLVGMFFELGGNMILTKHVARKFYSSIYYALKIRIVSILITLAVFFSVLYIFNLYEESRLYIIYASAGLAFSSMMNLYFAFFRGVQKMNYEAVVLIIQKALFIILALILIYSEKSGARVLLAFMISMAAGFGIIFSFFKKKEPEYVSSGEKYEVRFREYVKDVFSLALVEVFSNIYYRLNQVMIEHFRGFAEVGVYGVAYKVVEVFTNFPAILLIALFPAFAKMAVENLHDFKIQFDKILGVLISLGFLAGIGCWFLGRYFFTLIGTDYKESYIVLRYLTFPLVFLFPNFLITQGLIALNKNLTFASILFAALILNVILSLILVPSMGAEGSAISIGVCEMVIFITGYLYIRNYMRIA
jgi:O-antigen/teichoic acid export membrane protein